MEQPKTNYTDFWARKMRKLFQMLDAKKQGYITFDDLEERAVNFLKAHPELDETKVRENMHHAWKEVYNCGQDVPKGYHLTEETFIKNMWVAVHQPNLAKMIEEMASETTDKLKAMEKGYLTKEEFISNYSSMGLSSEELTAMFNAMDTDNKGKVHRDGIIKAKLFYFTDVSDESNPMNLMFGPLN